MAFILSFYKEPEYLTSQTVLDLNKRVPLNFDERFQKYGVRINNIQTTPNSYMAGVLIFYRLKSKIQEIRFGYQGWENPNVLLPEEFNKAYIIENPGEVEVELTSIDNPLMQAPFGRLVVEDLQHLKLF